MKSIIAISILVFSLPAFALDSASNEEVNARKDSSSTSNLEVSNLEVSKFEKNFWGLSDREWQRYLKIKPIAQKLGKTVVSSTPPEILAIFAENNSERRRLSKLFAEKYDLYVSNLLEVNASISSIQGEMYANKPVLNPNKVNALRGSPFRTTDTIQYFTQLDCDDCDIALRKLIRQVRLYGMKMDVFFVGEDVTEDQIKQYAEKNIPEELVLKNKLTLNKDPGFANKHNLLTPVSFISHDGGPLENHDPNL